MNDQWLSSVENHIDKQVEKNISAKDYRFYQIGRLKRVASRVDMYERDNCVECRHFKSDVEELAVGLNQIINGPGVLRKEYENRLDNMVKHMRDKHNLFVPFYFAYRLSFIYMLWGIGLGLLLGYSVFPQFMESFVLISWGVGVVIGNFVGSKKDADVRRTGRLL